MMRIMLRQFQVLLWYALVVCASIGVRYFVSGPETFHEYTSIFLYGSDIVLALLALSVLPELAKDMKVLPWKGSLVIFLAFASISILGAPLPEIGLVAFARLLLCVVAAVGARKLLSRRSIFIMTAVLVGMMALFQATVAIMQFTAQTSVGLGALGESPLDVLDPGTAKVTVEGVRLIRAYGTMPDPNILAGYLLVGALALAYLFLKSDKGLYLDSFDRSRSVAVNLRRYLSSGLFYGRIVIAAGLFIIAMALVFTFSRSGWISAVLATFILLLFSFRRSPRAAGRFLALFLIMAGALYYFFSPLIVPRASVSADEPSFSYRVEYGEIGMETVSDHALLGTGIGNQVQVSRLEGRYEAHGMSRLWEYQPVHNLYLLVASEIGVVGALSFVLFLAIVMWRLMRQEASEERNFALALLSGLLVFGLFDHFLWDIQAGKLMFWLAIALALAVTDKRLTTNDLE